ncbi:hypothetical protein EYF80_048698 [Liparis tanakae]|uniref:Uncharacterized protein n=1 Tax=Liparis tanakae TaxID=230148 RepID=A0A4Z2FIW0_9TELE|nr:hypothetical protein EYF80_048698 [Liparis tanakae]
MAYPTVMSKMLEPTELDTAISPSPLRATITLVMRTVCSPGGTLRPTIVAHASTTAAGIGYRDDMQHPEHLEASVLQVATQCKLKPRYSRNIHKGGSEEPLPTRVRMKGEAK